MHDVNLLQVKSYGDLVIAAAAAERVAEDDRARVKLVIARHLSALCKVVAPKVDVIELDTPDDGVPSFFDVRKNGLAAAIRSGLGLRRAIRRVSLRGDAVMLVDRLRARERFMLGGASAVALPSDSANIYLGYDRSLDAAGIRREAAHAPAFGVAAHKAGIFPGSRLAKKNLPQDLVVEVLTQTERAGVPCQLFLLDGERPDLERSGLPFARVPRQFSALREALASLQLVVSADSLSAHLAEMLRARVFVFTPERNEFWMPPSVFSNKRWSLFGDSDRMEGLKEMLG